jgi:GDP-D-mannose 3',5'-epimerase
MGFIENNKAECMLTVLISTHMLMAAKEVGKVERFFYSSSACAYNTDKQQEADVTALKEVRRLPGHGRRRLRLGEALQRADVPPLHGRLRHLDARRPLPQRLRPLRHLGRRTREGPRRHLPQGHRGQRPGTTRSRSGATASRPAASCTSTTASKASTCSPTATSRDPINLGSSELVSINTLVDYAEAARQCEVPAQIQARRPQGRPRTQ